MTSEEERIELVRRGFEAFDAGDTEGVLELFSPDLELHSAEGLLNAGTFRGYDGFVRWTQQWVEAWGELHNEPRRIVAVGDRHAVAEVFQTGRGRGSGVEVEMTVGWVFEYDGERGTYLALYNSYDDALAAAREREGIAAPAEGD